MAGLLIVLLFAQGAAAGQLCLAAGSDARTVARYDTGPGNQFSLSFIHSVSMTPVIDVYRLDTTGLVQTAEIFQSHGAGLPSFAGDIGEQGWRHEEGKFILDMARQFDRIRVRVQKEYKNTLHIGAQSIQLADLDAGVLTLSPCKVEE